jgi:hypothetical protein
MKLEHLVRALTELSPKEKRSLVEILEKQNLHSRRQLARREVSKGSVVSESKLFKNLG